MSNWPKGWQSFVEAQDERTQKRLTREFNARVAATCSDAPADPDSAAAYLALAAEDIGAAITHLEAACDDSRVDASVRRVALDALRDALTAVEAEMEASNAQG